MEEKVNKYLFIACGRKNNFNFRIVGGQETQAHEYPWMVFLKITEREGDKLLIGQCGASIISDEFLLTAAHCVKK